MRVIDANVDVWAHETWMPRSFWDGLEQVSRTRPERQPRDAGSAGLIAAMDTADVQSSIIMPVDPGPTFESDAAIERRCQYYGECAAGHDGRLFPFVGIDPRR